MGMKEKSRSGGKIMGMKKRCLSRDKITSMDKISRSWGKTIVGVGVKVKKCVWRKNLGLGRNNDWGEKM